MQVETHYSHTCSWCLEALRSALSAGWIQWAPSTSLLSGQAVKPMPSDPDRASCILLTCRSHPSRSSPQTMGCTTTARTPYRPPTSATA